MNDGKWFAVYTQPNQEKRVTTLLSKKNITNYCPLKKVNRHWSTSKKPIFEPLFSSYVFVQLRDKEQSSVLHLPGVINFVYWLEKPVTISNEEIDTIRFFLKEYQDITVEKQIVNLKEDVKVINGPVMVRKGNILEIRNNTVTVVLPSLGHQLVAETRKDKFETQVYADRGEIRF